MSQNITRYKARYFFDAKKTLLNSVVFSIILQGGYLVKAKEFFILKGVLSIVFSWNL